MEGGLWHFVDSVFSGGAKKRPAQNELRLLQADAVRGNELWKQAAEKIKKATWVTIWDSHFGRWAVEGTVVLVTFARSIEWRRPTPVRDIDLLRLGNGRLGM